jgi:hypothetical protein
MKYPEFNEFTSPHLLFVSGESVDYEKIDEILKTCDSFSLGPNTWIVRKLPDRWKFWQSISDAVPVIQGQKADLFLCPIVSEASYRTSPEGGFGLNEWLEKS